MDTNSPAILTALGLQEEMELLQQYRPTPLLRVGDKPIIILIIENLSQKGIKTFEIILHHYPDAIEAVLGDGSRWGVQIHYHLCKQASSLYKAFTPILFRYPQNNILIGTGDSLPLFPDNFGTTSPQFLCDAQNKWLGWAYCSATFLKENISSGQLNLPDEKSQQQTSLLFSTQTPAALLSSNINLLSNPAASSLVPSSAHQAEKTLWISRGAIIHPTAKLIAPLFIGKESQIHAHVTLGPNAVIERRSFIDANSSVSSSLVCHDSYVGEGLNVKNSIIDRNLLANIEHGTTISITDNFIISELRRPSPSRWIFRILGRSLAALVLFLLSPLMLLLYLCVPLIKREYVYLPVYDPNQPVLFNWPAFDLKKTSRLSRLLAELPSLFSLIRGNIHWVGVSPLTKEHIETLPSYWKKLYFHSKVGIITLADLDHGADASEDERYASDAYYAARSSVVLDLKLILRSLLDPLKKPFEKRT